MMMILTKQLWKPVRRQMVISFTGSKMTVMRRDKLSIVAILKKLYQKHSKSQQLDRRGPLLKLVSRSGLKAKS